jgi:hypothetical protein
MGFASPTTRAFHIHVSSVGESMVGDRSGPRHLAKPARNSIRQRLSPKSRMPPRSLVKAPFRLGATMPPCAFSSWMITRKLVSSSLAFSARMVTMFARWTHQRRFR